MRRLLGKLTTTHRSFPGDPGIPYWQTLAVGAVLVLVALSLGLYLLGSPSPWAMLVLGILIGGAIAGNAGLLRPPARLDGHRHGDGRCVYSDGPVARCVFPEDPDTRAAWVQERAASDVRDAPSDRLQSHRVQSPTSGAWHPCQCSRDHDHLGKMSPRPSLLERISAQPVQPMMGFVRVTTECTEHSSCGPFTEEGQSGHGHGPSPTNGQWCWHFAEWYIGRPGEVAEEGSDLAWRQEREATLSGTGDPWTHKVYPTAKGAQFVDE